MDARNANCVMWMLATEANGVICLHLPVMLVDTMVCRFLVFKVGLKLNLILVVQLFCSLSFFMRIGFLTEL